MTAPVFILDCIQHHFLKCAPVTFPLNVGFERISNKANSLVTKLEQILHDWIKVHTNFNINSTG